VAIEQDHFAGLKTLAEMCEKRLKSGICPEILAVLETTARRMTGYAEILFLIKPNPAAKYCRFATHATQ
jgi:hypothetical protein